MRNLFLTLTTTMVLSNFCFGQEMTYVKGGTISLNNEIIKKPKNLLPILKKNNSAELMQSYKKYMRYKRGAQIFGGFSGMGFLNAVGYNTGVPKIDFNFVAFGVVSAGIADLFHRPAKRALKKVVENYNYNLINEKYESTSFIENTK